MSIIKVGDTVKISTKEHGKEIGKVVGITYYGQIKLEINTVECNIGNTYVHVNVEGNVRIVNVTALK